jgi:hypothetical protein
MHAVPVPQVLNGLVEVEHGAQMVVLHLPALLK